MKDFNQWHKILALLMHEFELKEFTVTSGMISGFREEFNGKLPTVTCEERNGALRIRLVERESLKRLVQ